MKQLRSSAGRFLDPNLDEGAPLSRRVEKNDLTYRDALAEKHV
jgi:hypothetical protein